jgi:SAM-dependent methyltransferase
MMPAMPPDHPAVQEAAPASVRAEFIARLEAALHADEFVKLVLAKPVVRDGAALRIEVRRVLLRGQFQLSFVHHLRTRDETHNFEPGEGARRIDALLREDFRHAVLYTRERELSLLIARRGQHTLLERPLASAAEPAALAHDRAKHRWVGIDRPFLTALGVTTAQHELIPSMARKWRQINKFVEVFGHALVSAGLADRRELRVLDFGSGKGYLTFAVHDHLRHTLGIAAGVTGVELRPDLVRLCNDAARRLGLEGLEFEAGDVRQHALQAVDVMIALHACDTATDHAIEFGVRAGARIILCAPCCHKEVRPQLLSPQPLRAILQHGVHLGQEAEMVTDGLRALLLEACGYATQVFEFISLEHTSKNKMILAVKREQPVAPGPVLEQVDEVKRFYGIREQCLERLLRKRLGAEA